MEQQKTHQTSHGYVEGVNDPTLREYKPSGYVKPDNTKDSDGDEIWPEGLPSEEVVHTDP